VGRFFNNWETFNYQFDFFFPQKFETVNSYGKKAASEEKPLFENGEIFP